MMIMMTHEGILCRDGRTRDRVQSDVKTFSQKWEWSSCDSELEIRRTQHGAVEDLRRAGGFAPRTGGFEGGCRRTRRAIEELCLLPRFAAFLAVARGSLREIVTFTKGFSQYRMVASASLGRRQESAGGASVPLSARKALLADGTHFVCKPGAVYASRSGGPRATTCAPA